MLIITYISVCILFLVSFLHVYWAFGGKWATNSVIPTKAGEKAFTPSVGMTLFIALLLSTAAIILLQQTNLVHFQVPNIIVQLGSWVCMIVFFIRVIGEFHYFGIFKRKKDTRFAKMDTVLYIPLCAFLSLSFLLAIIT
ncbi:DUF3995 domain-containing protein [Bacillus albus]|uniref:DUF3995 domain-containing protein n=1 Tax=Bacillus cereus group TaxID=86661 RepID=UPI0022E90DE3|nr:MULTISPECIES: DUF3995 domain-containing protein [Bacillus cereus group]MDA2025936.1 DUF3995 domain-containing protein [Bacillus cereus group sp. Bcc03]MDA2215714.1 DUF3995 domain-containing protein [Bacillus cereus group sp. Bc228]MDA2225910.1 DUF3995 domain-containing protein [Bacillus cereus group sp. Bc227]MDA2260040.1 DUF3995 domain-containing protein [Bacillus cereus group sp. Bc200]MDA2320312.1 DUF3995 domain-containing protein [Bacillus cereus group sp. Bc177]